MVATDTLEQLARLDLDRRARSGIPEVIFAERKELEVLCAIAERMATACGRALLSRVEPGLQATLAQRLAPRFVVEVHAQARMVVVRRAEAAAPSGGGVIGLLAAGTADLPVAEEARVMAQEMGCEVLHHYDVGVAGLHRLVEPLRELLAREVAAVVVVAGMEGALPTVVKSLVPVPVIGVPTSVGYGFGRPGEAALMTMLHSCAPGLTVVNVDNGLGGGATAALIANRVAAAALGRSSSVEALVSAL
ncbi:MAG: nickel pincer cofactor biosynthesis protein LarB [Proteobacteria bacterium]|nr:nickel pincer cofactor biosynthesis protein LarB [Pseudomonadota bacterium]